MNSGTDPDRAGSDVAEAVAAPGVARSVSIKALFGSGRVDQEGVKRCAE